MHKSLRFKGGRLDKKRFLKYIQEIIKFVCQFCTDCTCHRNNKHVYYKQKAILCIGYQIGLIKNVLDLQYINILGSQQTVMKFGTVGPANHKCFLSSV